MIKTLEKFEVRKAEAIAAWNQRAHAWQGIESAPYNTPVRIKAGEMTFVARLLIDAAMTTAEETCDQWVAEHEGEHPPCWTNGACWQSNENDDPSLRPVAWQLFPTADRERIAELEAALRFYADRPCNFEYGVVNKCPYDDGETARQALKGTGDVG